MPEDMKEFNPGEITSQFSGKQPESRRDPPPIKMEVEREELLRDPRNETLYIRNDYGDLFRNIRVYSEDELKTKEVKEKLANSFSRANHSKLSQIRRLNTEVIGPMNEVTYPADRVRTQLLFYDEADLYAEHSVVNPDTEPTKIAILDSANYHLMFFSAATNFAESAGNSAGRYWDAWLMTNLLITASGRRRLLLMEEFDILFTRNAFETKNKEEVEVIESQKKILKEMGLEPEGIWGEVIDGLSEQHFWKTAVSAASNYNPLEETPDRILTMKLTSTQLEFVREVFKIDDETVTVAGKTFPESLLHYQTTVGSGHSVDKWFATMKALMLTDSYQEVMDIGEDFENFSDEKKTDFKKLVDAVLSKRDKLISKRWRVPTNEEKIVEAVLRMGLGIDSATNEAAEFGQFLSWEEKTRDGKTVMVPKLEVGSPNTATDIVNAILWLYHELDYSKKGRVRTPMIVPFDTEWDDFVREKGGGIGWIPNITGDRLKEYVLKDPNMVKAVALVGMWDLDKDPDPELKEFLDEVRGERRFNEKFKGFLEEISFGLPTAYKDEEGNRHVSIVPLRTGFTTVNFFRNLRGKDGKTVKDRLNKGALLKDVDFKEFNFAAFDSLHVNLSMMTRVLSMMYGIFDEKAAGEYLNLDSAFTSLGHIIKRWDIFGRAEVIEFNGEKVPRAFFEVVYAAYETVAYTAIVKNGLWDDGGFNSSSEEAFWRDMQQLEVAAESLPEHKGTPGTPGYFENYRDSIVLTMKMLAQQYIANARLASKGERDTESTIKKENLAQKDSVGRPKGLAKR